MTDLVFTARALAALGHEARLEVFRLLVRSGDEGLIIGDVAEHTGMPLSTLAHHLKTLVAAGLVKQERRGGGNIKRPLFVATKAADTFPTSGGC